MRHLKIASLLFWLSIGSLILAGCGSRENPDPRETAWQRYHQEGLGAFQQGQYARADTAWQKALEVASGFLPEDPRRQRTLDDLARLCVATGQIARAENLYTELLDLQQQTDPYSRSVPATLGRLADVYRTQKEPARAESLYARLLALQEKANPRHPDIAFTLGKLADLYAEQGRFLAADSLASRAMALKFHQQGYTHFISRRNREAEVFYRRALDIQERKLAGNHPDLARTCYDLGLLFEVQEKFAPAEIFYRRALAIQESIGHPERFQTLDQLAGLLEKTDRSQEAALLREQASTARATE